MRATVNGPGGSNADENRNLHPNQIIYRKMEGLIGRMLSGEDGVPIKTVKSFLTKIPSVFTGQDLINWLVQNVDIEDLTDALHLSHMVSSHGYIFQIDDHILTVKNDGTYYRFQTPYFWPSNCWEPENTDYAVYLCKRTMQNKAHLELEDFEAENLAKLQKMYSRKWEFVFMQAEAQYKVDKKRDRQERQILDSQERAFWDLHRPVPGCVNTTEVDFRKLSRSGRPKYSSNPSSINGPDATTSSMMVPTGSSTPKMATSSSLSNLDNNQQQASTSSGREQDNGRSFMRYHQRPGHRRCTHLHDTLKQELAELTMRMAKNVLRMSKVAENYVQYYEHRRIFDAFISCPGSAADPLQGQPNPWLSDTVDFWQHDKITGEISMRRLKLWEESFEELLADPVGRETLQKFLDKEYSGENLRFWMKVQSLRTCSCRMVPVLVTEIYNEFIDTNATLSVNIDCKVKEETEENLTNPNRWSFDEAAEHIFTLMKNDSYQRFLRSDLYRAMVNISKKKTPALRMTFVDLGLRFPTFTSASFYSSASSSQKHRDSASGVANDTGSVTSSHSGPSPHLPLTQGSQQNQQYLDTGESSGTGLLPQGFSILRTKKRLSSSSASSEG